MLLKLVSYQDGFSLKPEDRPVDKGESRPKVNFALLAYQTIW